MIIQNSSVAMASHSERFAEWSSRESLTVWDHGPRQARGMDRVTLSPEAGQGGKAGETNRTQAPDELEGDIQVTMEELEMELIRHLFRAITGRELRVIDLDAFRRMQGEMSEQTAAIEELAGRARAAEAEQPQGWGMIYQAEESYVEREEMLFAASGVVHTADGQEIEFTVDLAMSREYAEYHSIDVRAGDAAAKPIDPLVINFAGTAAQLTQRDFHFDLDMDGGEETIAFVGAGSGMLAFDGNNDGVVNDGSELFGPKTGDGFAELAAHDDDGNGWIDEADSIYDRLRIWTREANGDTRLFALGEKGVGAIHLGRVESPFEVKDNANNSLGLVRSTGIFLKEDGSGAGTVQQVDLVA